MRSLAWLLKKAKSYRCGQVLIHSNVLVQLSRVRFQRSRLMIGSCSSIDLQGWANDRLPTVISCFYIFIMKFVFVFPVCMYINILITHLICINCLYVEYNMIL